MRRDINYHFFFLLFDDVNTEGNHHRKKMHDEQKKNAPIKYFKSLLHPPSFRKTSIQY